MLTPVTLTEIPLPDRFISQACEITYQGLLQFQKNQHQPTLMPDQVVLWTKDILSHLVEYNDNLVGTAAAELFRMLASCFPDLVKGVLIEFVACQSRYLSLSILLRAPWLIVVCVCSNKYSKG